MILVLAHKERDLRDVPDFASVLILVEFEMCEVFLERVADNDFVVQNFLQLNFKIHNLRQTRNRFVGVRVPLASCDQFTYNRRDFGVRRRVFQVSCFDPGDPLSVVDNLGPRFDESIEDDVAVEVDDGDSSESVTFLRQNPLAVECQNFSLSTSIESGSGNLEIEF